MAEFIEARYCNARKIVEIGVGRQVGVAVKLAEKIRAEIILTDINPDYFKSIKTRSNVRLVVNDIFNPNWKLYEGADLIYSIRPNPEVQKQIIEVAFKSGADSLLKVLSDEWPETDNKYMRHEVVNYKGVILHLFLNTVRQKDSR
ncbi:MAG: hypothetical protein KIH01_02890 [Candidatus Freyarchaeota archaeon]|nr:hypothetical protein [Candidatus Jordarchaeia archaeon]